MIAYVDTSALLKLLVEEEGSDQAAQVWDAAEVVAAVPLVVVEGRAALAAAARAGRLTAAQHRRAKRDLGALVDALALVELTDALLAEAADLAESAVLRGDDAVHLAGALTVGATVMLSADGALCHAAEQHGLHIANPVDG